MVHEHRKDMMGGGFVCSNCDVNYNYAFNYCPDCGKQHKIHNPYKTIREKNEAKQ